MIKLEGEGPVVFVDDDPDARNIASAVFQMSSVKNEVLLLSNGKELVKHLDLVNTGAAEKPSIIFLDVNMPPPDGHETLQLLRTRGQFFDLPKIIIFTVSNDPRDVAKAIDAGADAYMIKPFGLNEFVDLANSLI